MIAAPAPAPTPTFAYGFPDAPYDIMDVLTALNIINGDENGMFNPDKNVTRAEFTKMVVCALGETAAAEALAASGFADAADTSMHWAAGYIAQGTSDGFIDGYYALSRYGCAAVCYLAGC